MDQQTHTKHREICDRCLDLRTTDLLRQVLLSECLREPAKKYGLNLTGLLWRPQQLISANPRGNWRSPHPSVPIGSYITIHHFATGPGVYTGPALSDGKVHPQHEDTAEPAEPRQMVLTRDQFSVTITFGHVLAVNSDNRFESYVYLFDIDNDRKLQFKEMYLLSRSAS